MGRDKIDPEDETFIRTPKRSPVKVRESGLSDEALSFMALLEYENWHSVTQHNDLHELFDDPFEHCVDFIDKHFFDSNLPIDHRDLDEYLKAKKESLLVAEKEDQAKKYQETIEAIGEIFEEHPTKIQMEKALKRYICKVRAENERAKIQEADRLWETDKLKARRLLSEIEIDNAVQVMGEPVNFYRRLAENEDVWMGRKPDPDFQDPVPSQWASLNEVLCGGWHFGELHTFCAPTGSGKSIFLIITTIHLVQRHGLTGIYVNVEDGRSLAESRMVSHITGVPQVRFRKKEKVYIEEERIRLKKKWKNTIPKHFDKLFTIDAPMGEMTAKDVRRWILHYQKLGIKVDFVVYDYLDEAEPDDKIEQNYLKKARVYRDFVNLGKEFNIIVITASQVASGTQKGSSTNEETWLNEVTEPSAESKKKVRIAQNVFTMFRPSIEGRYIIFRSWKKRDGKQNRDKFVLEDNFRHMNAIDRGFYQNFVDLLPSGQSINDKLDPVIEPEVGLAPVEKAKS